jgi:hypothetical protein
MVMEKREARENLWMPQLSLWRDQREPRVSMYLGNKDEGFGRLRQLRSTEKM